VTGAVAASVLGPLPQGTVVLEASAGTGKTWTIAALATRYVAETELELSQLMLVTFGRAATQELRERTRSRLTSAALGLADVEAARRGDDALLAHLATGPDEVVAERRRRLLTALSDFDAATITTTHSFCQRMLDGLGIAGDREPGAEVVERLDDLVTEVADDLYLGRFADHDCQAPRVTPAECRQVVRDAVADRQARLVPDDAPLDSASAQRLALATAGRCEVERRKRAAGVRDFDDLLVLLRDALLDEQHGDAGCARVRERYRVVLVDEFQDTDPVQWEVLQRAFHGSTTLVLIGDPKQAIYAFRGAEVLSYLEAVRAADRHETLTTNWRSDADLLRALERLYGGAALGHPDIVVRQVTAARPGTRLPGEVPLRVRQVSRTGSGPVGRSGFPAVAALRRRVAADLADELVRLLDTASLTTPDGSRPVEPGDVAVLVRKRLHIGPVREALERVGVPSVLAGATSVFETPAAADWLWLLQALEQPHRPGRVRLAALTPLLGLTADRLDDRATTGTGGFLRELAGLFERSGFAAVVERLAVRTDLDARLLGQVGGERRLTDLHHLAQVLDRAAVEQSLGLTALVAWLTARIADPQSGSTADRSRRLESDAAAVQVLTVHTSKGLEFPVVHVPFGWDGAKSPQITSLLLHDAQGRRVLDLGGRDGPGWGDRKKQSDREEAGEELRLLYVALTRAQSQVVAWWAPGAATAGAPLHRLLLGRAPDDPEPAQRSPVPSDEQATARLAAWAAGAPDVVAVEQVGVPVGRRWSRPAVAPPALGVAQVTRTVDRLWRRTSYSALTASAHDAAHLPGVASEPEQPERTDEPDDPRRTGAASPRAQDVLDPAASGPPSPMDDLPAGAAFGTLVHEVLEQVDLSADDLAGELLARTRTVVSARLSDVDPGALAAALLPVLRTPLDPAGTTLAGLSTADRLAELDFELPLAGGDSPCGDGLTLRGVARLLRRHLPPDDPLAGYPELLDGVEAPPLRGYLSGSIDAVLRLPGPRYVVVDYKTNRLGRGPLTALHYTRPAMAAEMLRAHYPLQALLYAVALHRYLRWRQPGYDPALHLGGTAYLFVRGMVGPVTPAGCGVFDWHPPAALVAELSDLLAAG
jgi:exodeoxyribonuclease V beta subunit